MFNRSEILRSAWAAYRIARTTIWAAGDENGNRVFIRSLFAKMLRRAWEVAKGAAAIIRARLAEQAVALRFVELQHRSMAAKAATFSPEARSVRISSIRDEIQLLDYTPWGVRVSHRRAALKSELAALTA